VTRELELDKLVGGNLARTLALLNKLVVI